MLKKVREKNPGSALKISWVYSVYTLPSSKFRGNSYSSFCVIPVTNKQIDIGENINSLSELTMQKA